MLKLVTRAQWGARKPRKVVRKELNSATTSHWEGTLVTVFGKKEWDHKYCASLVRGIQNYHMDARDYIDVGYNFLECPHGYTFEGRGLDVINAANGTTNGNQTSHAICSIAGPGNPFPLEEKVGFKAAVAYISEKTGAPNKCIGHRDHKQTECPGDERYGWVHTGMPTYVLPDLPPGEDDEMKPRLVRAPNGAVYAFDGTVLRPANNAQYQSIVRWYGGQSEPWDQWTQEQIDSCPKETGATE